jgi:hypothetical protein
MVILFAIGPYYTVLTSIDTAMSEEVHANSVADFECELRSKFFFTFNII